MVGGASVGYGLNFIRDCEGAPPIDAGAYSPWASPSRTRALTHARLWADLLRKALGLRPMHAHAQPTVSLILSLMLSLYGLC